MTKILTREEMIYISSKHKDICAYTLTLFGEMICIDTPKEAEERARKHGWWACNTKEVKNKCQSQE